MPGLYNIAIYQGATLILVITWTAGGVLVNLTGYTANMQFRPAADSSILLYDASSDLVLGGPEGNITLTIPASVTEGFAWETAVYDLLLTEPDGGIIPLIGGQVTVTESVTVLP